MAFPSDHHPSIDSLPGVHSRDDVATATSGSECLSEHRVPTAWFRTTSPVFSAVRPIAGTAVLSAFAMSPGVAGLLHPAADRGVRRVSARSKCGFRPSLPVSRDWRSFARHRRLPRDATYPSKDSSHPQPYRVTTAVAVLTFSSRRPSHFPVKPFPIPPFPAPSARSVAFKALLRLWVRTIVRRIPARDGLSSLGFFPLQGPSTDARPKPHLGGWPPVRRVGASRAKTIRVSRSLLSSKTRLAPGFGEHRSVPYWSLSSRRSSRRGRARRHGPNSRRVRRRSRKQSALQTVLPRPETSARRPVSRAFSRSLGRCPPPRGWTFAPWPRPRPRRKNKSFALPDDEPVGIPLPFHGVRTLRLPVLRGAPMGDR